MLKLHARWTGLFLLLAAACGCRESMHDLVHRRDLEEMEARLKVDRAEANARNALQKTPLHYTVTYGSRDAIDLLVKYGADVNAKDVTGLTPLHVAAMMGDIEGADRLLSHGADLEARDQFGDTPFHTAAVFGQLNMLKHLKSVGARLDAVNDEGKTPLDGARRYRKDDVVAFLTQGETAAPQSP